MELITTYPAAVNSKATVTMGVLDQATTIVEVLDATVLPEAPNLLVLGTDQTAETVLMTARENNTLTIQRAVQGIAKSWPAGTQIARNFTGKDWDDMRSNVEAIATKILGLTASDVGALPNNEPVPIDKGGTGATTAEEALSNLGGFPVTAGVYSPLLGPLYFIKNIVESREAVVDFTQYDTYIAHRNREHSGLSVHISYNDSDNASIINDAALSLKFYDDETKTWSSPFRIYGEHYMCPNGAGAHNATYRGKSLGSAVTDVQWAAISDGTFRDLYIGDYWTIGGINYRIAAFDYYYRTGDTSCDTHHVVLVPDVIMYTHVMNDTNITDGAYVGSKMYTEGLTQAKTTINNAFGSAHILNHRQLLCNATANGYESGHAWYDSTVELMTEQNVYGCKIFGNQTNGTGWAYNYTIDKSQYPLFTFRPDMISNRQWFWLRDVASAANFANVTSDGNANVSYASYALGVRPAFSIKS